MWRKFEKWILDTLDQIVNAKHYHFENIARKMISEHEMHIEYTSKKYMYGTFMQPEGSMTSNRYYVKIEKELEEGGFEYSLFFYYFTSEGAAGTRWEKEHNCNYGPYYIKTDDELYTKVLNEYVEIVKKRKEQIKEENEEKKVDYLKRIVRIQEILKENKKSINYTTKQFEIEKDKVQGILENNGLDSIHYDFKFEKKLQNLIEKEKELIREKEELVNKIKNLA